MFPKFEFWTTAVWVAHGIALLAAGQLVFGSIQFFAGLMIDSDSEGNFWLDKAFNQSWPTFCFFFYGTIMAYAIVIGGALVSESLAKKK